MTLTLVVAVLGSLLVSLLVYWLLDDEKHYILKLLLLVFVFSGLLLLPKVASDSYTICDVVLSNATVNGAVTINEYALLCFPRSENTPFTFLRNTQLLYYITVGYVIVYLAVWAMINLYNSVRRKGLR